MTAALSSRRLVVFVVAALGALAVAVPLGAAPANAYTVHALVSDGSIPASMPPDSNLVNAWGLAAGPTSPWWVADNGADVSTLYTQAGTKVPVTVGVDSAPTGVVFNVSGGGFPVSAVSSTGTPLTGSSVFIFATESGTIHGWNPGVPPPASHPAQTTVDRSGAGAVYKGLAIAVTPAGTRLYATDFHNGRVDVFDSSWTLLSTPGAFTDPSLPSGYAPFGIQTIGGKVFVTFAKQQAGSDDEQHGQGLGFVDEFDTSGNLVERVAQHGQLNAPWGLASAPDTFGRFGGDLLVGNFGDGEINAYAELPNGHFEHRGELRSSDGGILRIDGLWALQFGMGAPNNGPRDTLFFTAGPNDESEGLFGSITAN
jgi:uncharacterized protein (TIGR03118 family)